jgi:hypothetical protein
MTDINKKFTNTPPNTTPDESRKDDSKYTDKYTSRNATSMNDSRPDVGTRDMNYKSYNVSDDESYPVVNRENVKKHLIRDEELELEDYDET